MVGDRDVFHAELVRSTGHFEDRVFAIRVRGVAVNHALDVSERDEIGESTALRGNELVTSIPELGRDEDQPQRGEISIDPTSEYFRSAERGDYLPLACVIHHEGQHQHGASERDAYLASIQFLKRHDAPQPLIESVIETALRIFAAPTTKENHMKFVPRLNANGKVCCENPVALCEKCQAHHHRVKLELSAGYEPPDPYAPRALEMSAEERESLGAFADGVATMRGASNAPVAMSADERDQLGAFADGVESMRRMNR
jgi:hypothetical protein